MKEKDLENIRKRYLDQMREFFTLKENYTVKKTTFLKSLNVFR